MATSTYEWAHTGLLIVDPYNDFMSEGGKLYDATKPTADSVGFYDNMRKLIPAVRKAGVQVFISRTTAHGQTTSTSGCTSTRSSCQRKRRWTSRLTPGAENGIRTLDPNLAMSSLMSIGRRTALPIPISTNS